MRFGSNMSAAASFRRGLSCAASVFVLWGCNGNDPLPQEVIDGLPPETGSPSAQHRPGQPCLVCHSNYGGASPELAIGGTIFKIDPMSQAFLPIGGVKVLVNDSTGDSRIACTNAAGNFYVEKDKWVALTYPIKVTAGSRRMSSIVGREGSCAACHQLPSADRPEADALGRSSDSAGIIVVEDTDVDPMTCGMVP